MEKKVIVYHENETLARRARAPHVGETITYRAIADWDEEENAKYDEIIDLAPQE